MSFEVRITLQAWADAENIFEWIRSQGAPSGARRWLERWLRQVGNLEAFPRGRSLAAENGEIPGVEIHQQILAQFRTLYVVQGRQVFVIHARRGSRETATQDELRPGIDAACEGDSGGKTGDT